MPPEEFDCFVEKKKYKARMNAILAAGDYSLPYPLPHSIPRFFRDMEAWRRVLSARLKKKMLHCSGAWSNLIGKPPCTWMFVDIVLRER